MLARPRPRRRFLAALAVAGLAACGGGAGEDEARFCDAAAEEVEAFRSAQGQVSPAIIGVLRELVREAPGELADDFETVTESTSEQEADRALAEIESFLIGRCDLDVRS